MLWICCKRYSIACISSFIALCKSKYCLPPLGKCRPHHVAFGRDVQMTSKGTSNKICCYLWLRSDAEMTLFPRPRRNRTSENSKNKRPSDVPRRLIEMFKGPTDDTLRASLNICVLYWVKVNIRNTLFTFNDFATKILRHC